MKTTILEIKELTDSRELMEAKIPPVLTIFIYLLLAFFIAALAWSFYGEMEEHITTVGAVRPCDTASTIKNAAVGKIEHIYFQEGTVIKKGDVLYSLVIPQTDSAKELAGLKKIRQCILDEENYFNDNLERSQQNLYYYQYMDYRTNIEKLNTVISEKSDAYERSQKLALQGAVAQTEVEAAKNALHLAELDIQKYKNDYLSNLTTKIEELSTKHEDYVVKAPMDGIVHALAELKEGDLVQNGEEIATIVPETNTEYRILLHVSNKDIAKIKAGNAVKCQFEALPYQEYGEIDGTVVKVGTDAQLDRSGESYYLVEARIENKSLYSYKGKPAQLKLGMTCKANIILDSKKIINYVRDKLNFDYGS